MLFDIHPTLAMPIISGGRGGGGIIHIFVFCIIDCFADYEHEYMNIIFSQFFPLPLASIDNGGANIHLFCIINIAFKTDCFYKVCEHQNMNIHPPNNVLMLAMSL